MSILPHENFERKLSNEFRSLSNVALFKNLLRSTGAIIAGGSVLSSFHDINSFHDYDIYVHFNKAKNLIEGLKNIFLNFKFSDKRGCYTIPPYDKSFLRKNGILGRFPASITLSNPFRIILLDIIVVKNENSLIDVVKSFDLSFCKLWYDGTHIFAINPTDVLNKEGTLDPDYVKSYLEQNKFTLDRIEKYREKGYKILINFNSPSILLEAKIKPERKNIYSPEDWVLSKVFNHIVFGEEYLPYDNFFDLEPFDRFVQLNPKSIIDLIESLAYNNFSKEEIKEIFVGTFYIYYQRLGEQYSEYINSVLNKYFDISDIEAEFEKFDFSNMPHSDEFIQNIKLKKIKKYVKNMYLINQENENNSLFSEFSRNVRGSDYIMEDILNMAYGENEGAEESKNNRDDGSGRRKKTSSKRNSSRRKKIGSKKKSSKRRNSKSKRKSSGKRKSKSKRKKSKK